MSSVPSGKKTKLLFLGMENYLEKKMVRSNFWRFLDHLQNEFEHSQHWSDEMWKSKMAGGGGNKKKMSILY